MIGIVHQGDGGLAHLPQVEGADGACHAHGNAHIGIDQDARIGHRQELGLLHGGVVVVHKVHGVLVNIREQLG